MAMWSIWGLHGERSWLKKVPLLGHQIWRGLLGAKWERDLSFILQFHWRRKLRRKPSFCSGKQLRTRALVLLSQLINSINPFCCLPQISSSQNSAALHNFPFLTVHSTGAGARPCCRELRQIDHQEWNELFEEERISENILQSVKLFLILKFSELSWLFFHFLKRSYSRNLFTRYLLPQDTFFYKKEIIKNYKYNTLMKQYTDATYRLSIQQYHIRNKKIRK